MIRCVAAGMGLMNWVVMAARAARHSVPAASAARSKDLLLNDEHQAARGYWQKIAHQEDGVTNFKSPPYVVVGKQVKLERPPRCKHVTYRYVYILMAGKLVGRNEKRARRRVFA
jgi:hypothetical protein